MTVILTRFLTLYKGLCDFNFKQLQTIVSEKANSKSIKMVESSDNRSKSTAYGQQPRSLNINWMKYDVTDENVDPNTANQ